MCLDLGVVNREQFQILKIGQICYFVYPKIVNFNWSFCILVEFNIVYI
jgi:hypothetical protein